MRADFCSYRKTFFLCLFYHLYAVLCRTVTQMQTHACLLRQKDISCHDDILYGIGNSLHAKAFGFCIRIQHAAIYHINIFTVRQNCHIIFSGKLHAFPVDLSIHNGFAILTDCRTSGFLHASNICQFFTLLSFCYRTSLQHMNFCYGCSLVSHIIHNIRSVYYRLCIRHRHDRCKTAMSSCFCAGLYIFFIFQSRIAQMHMQINKSGHDITALCVYHTGCFFLNRRSHTTDLIFFNQYVLFLFRSKNRIHNDSVFYQN